jgi:hypothetical protein
MDHLYKLIKKAKHFFTVIGIGCTFIAPLRTKWLPPFPSLLILIFSLWQVKALHTYEKVGGLMVEPFPT